MEVKKENVNTGKSKLVFMVRNLGLRGGNTTLVQHRMPYDQ